MEKQNANELKKRKKAEINRIATLVERARARDPRILKDKEEERQRKEDAKVPHHPAPFLPLPPPP